MALLDGCVGRLTAQNGGFRRGQSARLAVVGLAGRFPGAPDIAAFWRNLQRGHDSLRRFTKEELIAKGVPAEVYDHPSYVLAGQVLDDADKFDAGFWGISPAEARLMDPQVRKEFKFVWGMFLNFNGTFPTRCPIEV
jgi:acyl transferase domain-containing protein